ncbi:hypothetical protein TeGR_g4883, partial [Tetraparma gracilis]
AAGMSQAGEKQTLWVRCKLHHSVQSLSLRTADGSDPTRLKPAALKKTCARAGVSPIGSGDELLIGLVAALKRTAPAEAAASADSSSSSAPAAPAAPAGPALAAAVLSLADESAYDPIVVLRLSDPSLGASSPAALLRRGYLKMSLMIHPDRIGRAFPEATRAFQVLVEAFERLTSPDSVPSADAPAKKGEKAKPARISRSNDGCHRTRVKCPRCKTAWGDAVEGNPDYYYNIMMQGLRSFCCSTCLLEFGCMSATHECPKCRRAFEYGPEDYHRQVTCGSAKCGRKFGFMMYHMSDLALRTLRDDVVRTRDEKAKYAAGMKRRAESARRRNDVAEDAMELQQFKLGLANECPQCGVSYAELKEQGVSPAEHMLNCNDSGAKEKRKREKEELRAKKAKREEGERKQGKAEALASWQFLGSKDEQLYLLGEDELAKVASDRGVSADPAASKSGLIAAIVSGNSTSIVAHDGRAAGKLSRETLPSISTLQRMDEEELRCVLAAGGVAGVEGKGKAALLALVEGAVLDDGEGKKGGGVKLLGNGGQEVIDLVDDDDDDEEEEGSDGGWEPEE